MSKSLSGQAVLAVCESPFQAFCLTAMSEDGYFSKCADLCILVDTQGKISGDQMMEALSAIIGARIVAIDVEYKESRHLGIESIAWRYAPSCSIRQRRNTLIDAVGNTAFDVLLCASATPLVIDAKCMLCPKGFTVLYDDGTGTHNGAVASSLALYDEILEGSVISKLSRADRAKQRARHFVNAITNNALVLGVRAVCMFNPSAVDISHYSGVSIWKISTEKWRARVSEMSARDYKAGRDDLHKQLILLSLPDDVVSSALEVEARVVSILQARYSEQTSIRPHPRSNRYSSSVLNEHSEDIWELMCLKGVIGEDSVLIGFGSSAQVHPKLIFGMEPIAIFLHRLLPGEISLKAHAEATYIALRDRYSAPERVVALEDLSALEEVLCELNNQ